MRGRKRISMAGLCCYRPDGSDVRLAFHLREGAYDTDQLIPIVQTLGRLLGGAAPVTLVWDNLPAHHSIAMGAWLADQHAWLRVEYLPAYAPDLNPVEGLWANLKGWSWPTVPAVRWRSWPRRPSRVSGGCGASRTCWCRSCTRQGFAYEVTSFRRASCNPLPAAGEPQLWLAPYPAIGFAADQRASARRPARGDGDHGAGGAAAAMSGPSAWIATSGAWARKRSRSTNFCTLPDGVSGNWSSTVQ
jgi:hypothetical protein